uniref:Epidermal growth factor receptor pathway substrate 15 n=1 Tax=Anser brachyrhynchus TaxID=132585 RepID=A0A8B9CC25_9AVES
AAVFLKKSGLTDLVLGKIWDLADTDGKGILNKQEFFVALRLVACAQNGLDVSLSSLNLPVPPPRFTDTSSPLLLSGTASSDVPWAVKLEDKAKYDAIFDSLNPINGLLSGDKVKPVLLNSKLPVDILGRLHVDFCTGLFGAVKLVHKLGTYITFKICAVVLELSVFILAFFIFFSPLLPPLPSPQWVVSPADKIKYDEIFVKTDKDMDGFVSGVEARELFLKTGLPSALLAHIWALCDTKDCGKLSKEQFALAFYLINQKLTKGIDPPQALTPEMIPPSDRSVSLQKGTQGLNSVADFSAIKELDTLNNEIVDLQREKNNVEQDLKEKEDTIKQRTSEVQDLQDEVKRESNNLQKLQAQKQEAQEILNDLDEQKAKLEEQLNDIRQKCAEEAHLARNSPETTAAVVEEEKEIPAATITKKVNKCLELHTSLFFHVLQEDPFDAESHPLPDLVSEASLEFFQSDPFVGSDPFKDDPFGKIDPFGGDPFKGSDPFAADCFFKQSSTDPFVTAGTDPFTTAGNSNNTTTETLKKNDPFAPGGTTVTTSNDLATDPFASLFGNESFGSGFADFSTLSKVITEDPFSSSTSGSGNNVVITKNLFEEPPSKNEDVPPALPPKTGTPTRPCPPPPGKRPINQIDSSDSFKPSDPFQPFPTPDIPKEQEADLFCDPFAPTSVSKEADPNNFANFSTYSTEEDMIEWAKRESEREEKERLARLKQQEQEDLELAIALSKSEISEA